MDPTVRIFLSQIPIFEGFSDTDLEVVMQAAVKRQLPKGSFLFREGDPAEAMYLQMEGRTRSFTSDNQGKEFVFQIGEPGDVYGEISMIDDEPRSWSVQVEDDSTFIMFSKQDFRTALETYPQLKDKLILNLSRIIRRLSLTMKNLALLDVYGRVRALFEEMAQDYEDHWMIPEPLTQQAIADRVGSSREMIARILKELVFGGYVKLENKRIIILQKLPERF
ncbi:Crp/Fnr family transcriptional regulator [Chitiniphilus shinanonensis]|uniref:Crp/Fnr family transcriptional regulator n=1 Tax=Chitiniphilus shinanonensis TaxID=553088 RepID=A0ABQ6BTU6_9NEIS|nr:Crp/Fnr family transcriptional regulator [Chitiniphilus shinanonensis]GLS03219.1 Crp/Fnr family transcriptional regulator [Chitiniphilus shinanonensis]